MLVPDASGSRDTCIALTGPVQLMGLLRLPHNDPMAATYEYKALELREKYTGRRLSGDKLEKVLNEHAAQGW